MKKPLKLNLATQVDYPPKYTRDHWFVRTEGDLTVQYNRVLDKFGWPRLKAIAEKALKTCEPWTTAGLHKAEAGSLDGTLYISFPIPDPQGKIIVCIETQEGLERGLGVKMSDLAAYNYAGDGQHKHEGTKS